MRPETTVCLAGGYLGDSWEGRRWHATSMRLICCALVLIPSMAETLRAGDITWRNDSLVEGGDGYIQAGFVEGDIGAAVFDLPCGFYPIKINAVQVYWASQDPLMQVVTHVRVYGSGGANPGAPIYSGTGALMTPGFMLQFDSAGENWIIDHGPFTVGVQYVGEIGGPLNEYSGHLVTDADGCQPGKNLIYDAASGQWFDAYGAGVSGDFAIRVVFESSGNGCFGDSDCDGDVDLLDYADFQRCLSGDGNPAAQQCLAFDCDADGDVDCDDFVALEACMSGPDIACNSVCTTCQRGQGAEPPSPGPRWTGVQIAVWVAISAILLYMLYTSCYQPSCRVACSVDFATAGQFANGFEQEHIDAALDRLRDWGFEGDQEAENAFLWYDAAGAYDGLNQIIGRIKVNRWSNEDRQKMVAVEVENRIIVHELFVTGAEYSPEVLALILFAEWQHVDSPSSTERQLQSSFRAFRQRHGLETAVPDFQHGFSEGVGVDDPP